MPDHRPSGNPEERRAGSDDELVNRLLADDSNAWREAVEAFFPLMRSLAASITGDSIADEVVQEAWVSIHRALPKFEGRSSFKTWIMRIVANEAKTRLRRESRQMSLDSLQEDFGEAFAGRFDDRGHWAIPATRWTDDSPESLLQQDELQHCISKALQQLPEDQQSVFLLRETRNFSAEEVCNILDVSASNVRVLLHRARLAIYKAIEQYQETGTC